MSALGLAEIDRLIAVAGSSVRFAGIADDEEVFAFQPEGSADYHKAMGETGSILLYLHAATARDIGMKGGFSDRLPVLVAKRKTAPVPEV